MKSYQMKIMVRNMKPPVWWRLMVPAGISFSALSAILNEVIGLPEESFSFDFYQKARIWEPDEDNPLASRWDESACDAAGTMIDDYVIVGKCFSYNTGYATFKVTVEALDTAYPYSFPTLVKFRSEKDFSKKNDLLRERFEIIPGKSDYRTRTEILKQANSGVCRITVADQPESREGSIKESNIKLLNKVWKEYEASRGFKTGQIKPAGSDSAGGGTNISEILPLRSWLERYQKNEIQGIAKRLGVHKWRSKKLPDLREEVAVCLLNPEIMRRDFLLLDDDEIKAFEDALGAEGTYQIPQNQRGCFDTLCYMGYVFIRQDDRAVEIPEELPALYKKFNIGEQSENRKKVRWVLNCLNLIIPPYYGVLPLDRFCRLCRRTENPVITPEEVPRLLKCIPEEERESTLSEEMIVEKHLIEDRDLLADVIEKQADKPYYIMRQKEIEELVKYGYPANSGAYRKFRAFLIRELEKSETEIEAIIRYVHLVIAYGDRMQKVVDCLEKSGFEADEKTVNDFMKLYQAMVANTPTYYNRGYTPQAMAEMREGSSSVKQVRYDHAGFYGKWNE